VVVQPVAHDKVQCPAPGRACTPPEPDVGTTPGVLVAYLLLAAPVVAAVLFWGSWGWVAVAVGVAAVEYAALQRSQRISAKFWRTVGMTKRSTRERGVELLYLVSAAAGVAVLVVALLSLGGSEHKGRPAHGARGIAQGATISA
jgi:hypothetical protein